jgi:mono/diheme cytochrome c family protein
LRTGSFQGIHQLMAFSRPLCRVGFSIAIALQLATAYARSPNAEQGGELARRWCASCHVVSPDQKSAVIEAPPFQSIARRPDFDPGKLATFLLDPHPKMPDMGLSRDATADIAAYIATLK